MNKTDQLTSAVLEKWHSSILLGKIGRLKAVLVLESPVNLADIVVLGHRGHDRDQGQDEQRPPLASAASTANRGRHFPRTCQMSQS